ncbi:hypothetical protein SAMN02745121_05222 [Nannocystis exedens]|uniref:Uncharacterized protein n=1 Tax=Nannocystis exedens TaxID=54 RepID=A0A1I2CSD6_9BACT|nr:hypothetical protein [Nannocystis exedens]PCC68519.1 hypothetical protein NAEX_01535 [Nannocystis exedens]SFE71082.1 hypothetical protein SAMN02745121_05222 [Nannocystis exedens]
MRRIISATIHCFFLGLGLVAACDAGDITPQEPGREATIGCGGIDGLECPAGLECIDASGGVCHPETQGPDCVGVCEPIEGLCGGVADIACEQGWVCHDLADDCDPKLGHDNCLGGCRPLDLADKPAPKVEPEPEPEPAPLPEGLCGGPVHVECEEGWICHDLADDCVPSRGDSDCLGGCRPAEPGPDPVPVPVGSCGGPDHVECEEGWICHDLADDCDPARGGTDCLGGCRPAEPGPDPVPDPEPQPEPDLSCGVDGKTCDAGQICVDKLNDKCDPEQGHANCPGVCRQVEAPPVQSPVQCGGVGGLTCPKKQACVDDPSDQCDPDAGDIDCIGTCQDRLAP